MNGEDSAPRQPGVSEIRRQVQALDPAGERPASSREMAAVLLAALFLGHNIDRLARFAGVGREAVARAARRLVDNGVWREGNTVARWVEQPADAESFWADVEVAEGKLCRQLLENGDMEWAPQGYWRKAFDYTSHRSAAPSQVVSYQPHVEVPQQDLPYWSDEEEEEEAEAVAVEPQAEARVPATAEVAPPPVWLGSEHGDEIVEDTTPAGVGTGTEQLFPDAVWLG